MASFRMQTIWLIEYYTEINHTEINNDNLSDISDNDNYQIISTSLSWN